MAEIVGMNFWLPWIFVFQLDPQIVQESRVGISFPPCLCFQLLSVRPEDSARPGEIVRLPEKESHLPGESVMLVAPDSDAYAWKLNDREIPGATNQVLVFDSIHHTNSGAYSVRHSIAGESVEIEAVDLIVKADSFEFADLFDDRPSISGTNGYAVGDNLSTTGYERGEPFHDNKPGGRSVWARWVAPADGTLTLSTLGSGFDTLLAVYQGSSVDGLTTIASDDESGGFGTSRVSFNVEKGMEYAIAIDGFGRQTGNIVLGWEFEKVPDAIPYFVEVPSSQTLLPSESHAVFESLAAIRGTNNIPIDYQWFRGRKHGPLRITGETNSNLHFSHVTTNDVGSYMARADTVRHRVFTPKVVLEIGPDKRIHTWDRFDDLIGLHGLPASLPRTPARWSRLVPAGGSTDIAALIRSVLGQQFIRNDDATKDAFEDRVAGSGDGKTRWMNLTPEHSGHAVICVDGFGANPVIGVYEGNSSSSLRLIASDRNSMPDGRGAMVTIPVTRGRVYRVVVDTENNTEGLLCLNWQLGGAPGIMAQPKSRVKKVGGAVEFQIAVDGVPTPNIQWQKDGADLIGQTNRFLRIQNVARSDSGQYRAIVDNVIDFAISNPARLRVVEPIRLKPPRLIDNGSRMILPIERHGQVGIHSVIEATSRLGSGEWTPIYTNLHPAADSFQLPSSILKKAEGRMFIRIRHIP